MKSIKATEIVFPVLITCHAVINNLQFTIYAVILIFILYCKNAELGKKVR